MLPWQRKMAKLGRKPVFGPHIRLGDVVRFVTSRQSSLTAAGILHSMAHISVFRLEHAYLSTFCRDGKLHHLVRRGSVTRVVLVAAGTAVIVA